MSVLSGKNILLGVTAGIAAYKTAHLVRLFIKAGAHVKVVMTPASLRMNYLQELNYKTILRV